ncbi:aminotransferase class I/II-fold pyridoxal phosphate-dependent enzyme [Demequina zhanjiangensis]|uniref:Aminotransferase class I/II-fold pyridoxal phosphate-dependent enzyme n=1 Tax=Demequina zhanjiangensis TaxID=3051659 RepID=A0ABT8G4G6_9MICO|nr:aminotransferase class I/II-fold pyridoxal phosphate-dependent enzyme [Demequina sp. SYSU T00b26]MDN4474035.1 aminotransferase class I/II-fold pyridoxal phosphate-dependent enzyme [Demequina sp. SYSU T00b26]
MDVGTLVREIEEPNPQGIAAALSMLIRTGELPPGTRLPTVRALAAELGVSPATVSNAWHGLITAGLIAARGRAGTFVLEQPTPWLTPRSHRLAGRAPSPEGTLPRIDLATGMPDPALLPDIKASLDRALPRHANVATYLQPPLIPELEAPLRRIWPYEPQALTVVDGVMDGMERALRTVARFGDRVVVETPTFPVLLDLLEHLHLMAVPATMDRHGMLPESLDAALSSRPAAVVLQPRAHNPTGASLTAGRAADLAAVLTRHRYGRDAVVIEDDHSALVTAAPSVSLGQHLPSRTLHLLGFSKSHGPDLRIAALGGPQGAIDRIVGHRVLGPGWTSRMTQALLHHLLEDRAAEATVRRARYAYFTRQRELAAALRAAGVTVSAADGLNVWVPVRDEQAAQITLAAHGIRVSLGSAFQVGGDDEPRGLQPGPHRGDHIRVSLGLLVEGFPEIAAAIALAAHEG